MVSEDKFKENLFQGYTSTKASTEDFTRGSISIVDGYGQDGGQPPPFNYTRALKKFNSWVYAAANANAKAAASCPLRLYIRKRTGTKCFWHTKEVSHIRKNYILGENDIRPSNYVLRKSNQFGSDFVEVIDDHPILDLLSKVNPWQNQFDLAYLKFLFLELTGNAYMQIANNSLGIPEQVYILPSQWVDIIPSKRGSDRLVDGYWYGRDRIDRVFFSPEEVIQFKYPSPHNIYYGLGKIEAMWPIINVNEQLWNMRSSILRNNGRPDYAVIMKNLSNSGTSLERYSRMLEGMLKGTSNAGKMLVIPGDIDLKPLNFPPKDLGQDDQVMIEMIAAGFGIPITKLKMNDANYSNATIGEVSWRTDTIRPMLIMDEEKLNEQLLPLFDVGSNAFLAYDNCVPSDKKLELERITVFMDKGIITANEVRQTENLSPIDDGDIPLPALRYELANRYGLGSTGLGEQPTGGKAVALESIPVAPVVTPPVIINNHLDDKKDIEKEELHIHVHNHITGEVEGEDKEIAEVIETVEEVIEEEVKEVSMLNNIVKNLVECENK